MGFELPKEVTILEVGPRDGLQNEDREVPTEQKVRLVDALSDAGLKRIQVTSFVHPKRIPQLRDATEVWRSIRRQPGVAYNVLVPNLVGFQRACEIGAGEIEVVLSASESHNRLNVNRSTAESLDDLRSICEAAQRQGITIRAALATSFGCSMEGQIPPQKVVTIAKELAQMGVGEISLGDTVGMANPRQTYALFCRLLDEIPDVRLAAHFHDTRGMGLACALAALQAGVTIFDASIGGMGGCPGTPGAAGNVATEDLVNMFEEMGVSTGVDVGQLIACARLADELVGRRLPGQLGRAGLCQK